MEEAKEAEFLRMVQATLGGGLCSHYSESSHCLQCSASIGMGTTPCEDYWLGREMPLPAP